MSKQEFVITFTSLKLGIHTFEFKIGDSFFEEIEYSTILGGDVQVTFELEKKETMLIGKYHIEGKITTSCDRCTDDIEKEISGDYQLVYKFGGDQSDNEELIVLDEEEYQIDIKEEIYEFIIVSLPLRVIHSKDECNEEMMKLLDEYIINPLDEDEDDFEDFDDEDEDDEDEDDFEDDEDDDEPEDGDDDTIDPRWSILKNLN